MKQPSTKSSARTRTTIELRTCVTLCALSAAAGCLATLLMSGAPSPEVAASTSAASQYGRDTAVSSGVPAHAESVRSEARWARSSVTPVAVPSVSASSSEDVDNPAEVAPRTRVAHVTVTSHASSSSYHSDYDRTSDEFDSQGAASRVDIDLDLLLPQLAAAASRAGEAMDRADYGLSDEQRQQIFYARLRSSLSSSGVVISDDGSASFSESSDVDVSTPVEEQRELAEAVHEELNAEQQSAFEEEWVDRDLWWTELVGELESDEDAVAGSGASQNDSGAHTTESAPVPEQHLDGNLFDLLGQ